MNAGRRSKLERSLILARSQLEEVIAGAPLNEDWLGKLRTAENLMRSVEDLLASGRAVSFAHPDAGATDVRSPSAMRREASDGGAVGATLSHGPVGSEVRNWLTGSYTLGGDIHISGRPLRGSEPVEGFREDGVYSAVFLDGSSWQTPELQQLLSKVQGYDSNIFLISRELARANLPEVRWKPISLLFTHLMQTGAPYADVLSFCSKGVPQSSMLDRLCRFMAAVDEAYLSVPYHSRLHGADVMMIVHWFFQKQWAHVNPSPFDHFVGLIAGAIHDMGHDGVNNIFHIKTRSQVALRYNDRSVLENMHIAMAFELMSAREELNWSAFLDAQHTAEDGKATDLQAYLRKCLIEMVLSTDTTRHDSLLAQLEDLVARHNLLSKESNGSATPVGEAAAANDKLTLMKVLLHSADISNPTRPQSVMLPWCRQILREFWAQGDEERRLGLEVSPMCDRGMGINTVPQGQLGFINFVVKQLFKQVALAIPEVDESLEHLASNAKYWQAQKEAGVSCDAIFEEVEEFELDDESP